MISIWTGLPGSGKTTKASDVCLKLLKRNWKYYKKSGIQRPLYTNSPFHENIRTRYPNMVRDWQDAEELVKLRECDIFIDEIANYFDAQNWELLGMQVKRWLRLHEHYGIDIYANTQDFSMIDMRARLMVTRIASLWKIIGSGDPSPTKPVIKYIWGLVICSEVQEILTDSPHKKKYSFFGHSFFFIDREDIEIYDTRQDIPLSPPLPIKKVYTEIQFIGGDKQGKSEHKYL